MNIISRILLAATVISPIAYILLGAPDGSFWGDVMSGLLATAVALVAGIPLALWIDRHIKAAESRENEATAIKNEVELLATIRAELQLANDSLHQRLAAPGNLHLQPYKIELWKAISAAGKLVQIQDHGLLNRIASAYYSLGVVRELERRFYIALRGPTIHFGSGQTAAQLIADDVRRLDASLEENLQSALEKIDSGIAQKNSRLISARSADAHL